MKELERIRQEMRMTQPEMAARLGVSPRTYRDYVYRARDMHPALQDHTARTLQSARLALLVLSQFVGNPFAPLALTVDEHPARQLCVAQSELREAEEAILRIDPCKATRADYERLIDQHLDLIHLIPIAIGAWCAEIGGDLWDCRKHNVRKIAARGYLDRSKEAAA